MLSFATLRGVLLASIALGTACFGGDNRPALRVGTGVPDHGATLSSALYQSVGVALEGGHRVDVFDNGAVFDAIVDDIRAAQRSVHVAVYMWKEGRLSDRLTQVVAERARAGVECRVLVDGFGSRRFDEEVAADLERAGCETRLFRPSAELARLHRKIVVVDGRVAFTGGFGIDDDWLGDALDDGQWRDVAVRFEGPAVRDAQQAFAENWLESGGALLPLHAFPIARRRGGVRAAFVTSTASPKITRAERLVQLLINTASQRLWIANAYFLPPDGIEELLQERAAAGVDVRVLAPGGESDSKIVWGLQNIGYDDLMDAGVRIWEYEPTMLHSKSIIIDDELVAIGSINLEPLSLRNLEEASIVIEDRATNAILARSFLADCERAEEQTP